MKNKKDENTEQKIIDAAERLFLEKGFAMTSTTEIAREVGCNQALVHYYFRTKEKLFEAIFEKKIKMFVKPFLESKDDDKPFEERLKNFIENHYDLLKANPKVPFLFFNELLTNPVRLESVRKKIGDLPKMLLTKIEKDLKSEIKKGTIRPMNTIDLFISILSLNITIFLISPVLKNIINLSDEELNYIIENRKNENVLMILRSLKP